MNVTLNTSCCFDDGNSSVDENITRAFSSSVGIPDSFYISVGSMYLPGTIFNLIALAIIGKDIKTVSIPTNVLLFSLCLTDLLAVINSFTWHLVRYTVDDYSVASCSLKSVLGLFFPIYAGIVGVFMAVDRFLALCKPFYYKEKILPSTWCASLIVVIILLLSFCCLPPLGVGSIWRYRRQKRYCSVLTYHSVPDERIFGYMYGALGLTVVASIFIFNSAVVYIAVKLHLKIATVTLNGAPSPEKQRISFELQFAKLVGTLTVVFVVCWTPFNVLVLMQEAGQKVDYTALSTIHRLAGFNYVIDPFVYIFLRKTCRQKLIRMIKRCMCKNNAVHSYP